MDQYLELVNSSLPGEWSWWLWGEERCLGSPLPPGCWASLGNLGEGAISGCGIPGNLLEGMVLGCSIPVDLLEGCFWGVASLGTFWKGSFWGVGKEKSPVPPRGVGCSVRWLLLGSCLIFWGRKANVSVALGELPRATPASLS